MTCFVRDSQLVPWERALLGQVCAPRLYRGQLVWPLDAVPRHVLARLCWPRRVGAARVEQKSWPRSA